MLIAFRQGVLQYQGIPSYLEFDGTTVDLLVDNLDAIVAFADGDSDYLHIEKENVSGAWAGPFDIGTEYWLYWDIDTVTGIRTFGSTSLSPSYGISRPEPADIGQHHFDNTITTMLVWDGEHWIRKNRVFAGKITTAGTLSIFASSSQVGIYENRNVGYILFDNDGPLLRKNGTFLTTESPINTLSSPHNSYRDESDQKIAHASQYINKFQLVSFKDSDSIGVVSSAVLESGACVGIAIDDIPEGGIGTFVTSGYIENPSWNFSKAPGTQLFVGKNGDVTETPPPRISFQKIGQIVNSTTILLNIEERMLLGAVAITPTPTPTSTVTVTPTVTATSTVTPTVTPTSTVTPTLSPTVTVSPTPISISPTITPTVTPVYNYWTGDVLTADSVSGTQDASPVNIYYRRTIFTTTYSEAELVAAFGTDGLGNIQINKLRFSVTQQPANQPLPDYAIGMKLTTNGITTNNSGLSGGTFTLVKNPTSETFATGGVKEFVLDTPFTWVPGNNLVISWAWGQCPVTWSSSGTMPIDTGGVSYANVSDSVGAYTVFDSAGGNRSYRPVVQLEVVELPPPSITPTATPTQTVTPTVTPTLTVNASVTPTPSITPTPTPTPVILLDNAYYAGGDSSMDAVESFPFAAPFTTTTTIGQFYPTNDAYWYSSSVQTSTDGYAVGGVTAGGYTGAILSFPFSAPFTSGTSVGTLGSVGGGAFSGWTLSDGVTAGGYAGGAPPPLNYLTDVNRFPFATPFTTSNLIGSLNTYRSYGSSVNDGTNLYMGGGYSTDAWDYLGRVETISMVSFTSVVDVGGLTVSTGASVGAMSQTTGFSIAGYNNTVIESFPFAAPFTTGTNVGSLATVKYNASASSSTTDAFLFAGANPGSPAPRAVQRFPFAAPFTSTTVVGEMSVNYDGNTDDGNSWSGP
jgi:hypothetical protein